jgi:D-proline reductase (dithiol) PrdB
MDIEVFKSAFNDWLQKSQDHLIKSDWQSVAKDYPFLALNNQDTPYTEFNRRLKFCRVCVVTGGGLYLREKHQPFAVNNFEGDFSFRAIPRQIFADDIEMCHEYTETRYAKQDINVLFPLERLRELEESEVIGEFSERNYSIYDFIPQADRISQELAKPLADELVKEEIDIAE